MLQFSLRATELRVENFIIRELIDNWKLIIDNFEDEFTIQNSKNSRRRSLY